MRERVFVTDRGHFYIMSEDGQTTWYKVVVRNSSLEPYEWGWLQVNEPEQKPTIINDDNLEEWREIWNSR